jgi:2-polyprenyl-3-methyl-5-hydroxy-6-metoxy-1,4-benzoquinol methylase
LTCCSPTAAIDTQFDRREAESELARYRNDGPNATTQALVDAIARQGIMGTTLLDIGGGVGAVYHDLLERGVTHATHVDISTAYIDIARSEAKRRGMGDRVDYVTANYVDVADSIPAADVVTLDRVICCYPDMPRLVAASAQHARRVWGAVYPRGRLSARLFVKGLNFTKWLRRSSFRVFVHSPDAIAAALRNAGFEPRSVQRTFIWEVAVFVRSGF